MLMDKVRYIYEGRDRRRFEFRLIDEKSLTPRQAHIFYLLQVELIRDAINKEDIGLWRALLDYTRDSIPKYLNSLEMPEGFYGSEEEKQMTIILDYVMMGRNPLNIRPKLRGAQHLYFLVAGDVLKVGVSSRVKARMATLTQELKLPFELYRLINNAAHHERRILADLGPYWLEGQHGKSGRSRECFRWCEETKEYVDGLEDLVLVNA